ncbi:MULTISPECIES: MFS transporter [unclassified Caballeronia]|uniref:MFS transporter n=1 Tax=unclassified Caballeronia TaxID=2646786 RepID=UPI00158A97D3|nr:MULTISPECIES: MFS transporter [unclassified Caballeronia]QSN61119.1 MFS transporter [Caballeronia sp. M1242]
MPHATLRLKRFVAARFLSALADQFLLFAVPLTIFKSTGDLKYSGLAFVIEWVPRIIFFPLAGFVADRLKPSHLFSGIEFGRAFVLAVALALIASGVSKFAVLSVMMAILSIAYILSFVGSEAMLPRNLDASELPKAHSMLQAVEQITQVAGPALAALISVWDGLNPLLLIGAAMFGGASLILFGFETQSLPTTQSFSLRALRHSNRQAFGVLMQNKVLFYLSALTWVVNLVYGAALVVSAAVVVKVLGLPESSFGMLQTAAAVASIGACAVVPRIARKFGLPVLGITSFCAMIFAGLVLALSKEYVVYLVGYSALMACDGAFSIYIRTVRSQLIPKEHLGITTGLIGLMNMCSIPLSAALVTALSAHFSPSGIFGIIFAVAATLGIVLVVLGRTVFGYDTLLPPVEVN